MQKIALITVLLIYSFAANSQENLRSSLLAVSKNAAALDGLILQVDNDLKKDKHKDMDRLAGEMKNELSAINEKLSTIGEPNRTTIAAVVTGYNSDVDNFRKLTNKSGLFDKDKLMDEAFGKVKATHKQFRDLLKTTYTKALQNEEQKTPEKQPEPQQKKDTAMKEPVVAAPPVNNPAPNADNHAATTEVSGLIADSKKMIELYIDSVHLAMKKNNFSRVGKLAKYISNNCLQIEDLSLMLKSEQKESIRILSAGLRAYADDLQRHSKKGAAEHHELHDVLEKMEIKVNSLSVALNLVP